MLVKKTKYSGSLLDLSTVGLLGCQVSDFFLFFPPWPDADWSILGRTRDILGSDTSGDWPRPSIFGRFLVAYGNVIGCHYQDSVRPTGGRELAKCSSMICFYNLGSRAASNWSNLGINFGSERQRDWLSQWICSTGRWQRRLTTDREIVGSTPVMYTFIMIHLSSTPAWLDCLFF